MKYNFVKLLQEGGSVRKYQQASGGGILNINKPPINLDSDTLHTRLNDWELPALSSYITNGLYDFEKMYQHYLANKNRFKSLDIITATPTWEGAKVNDTGFRDWNEQFNQTGLNEYFGYDSNVADYYGPTTAARKAFYDFIKQKEAAGPLAELPTENNSVILPVTETPEDVIEEEKEISPKDEEPLNEDLTPEMPNQPEKQPWTDWLPLGAQLFNDLRSAGVLAKLQKLKRFPLIEAPFLQHKITNNYNLRTGMQLNANELRDLGVFRSNSSDLRLNLDNYFKYDTKASEIENQAELEKANKTAEERKIAENVANTNMQEEVKAANENAKINAVAWNNILDANARQMLSTTEAINSWIGNMYASHGEWLKDQRINDSEYTRGANEYLASLDLQKAYKEYGDISNDYTKSRAYQEFIEALKGDQSEEYGLSSTEDLNDPDKVKTIWSGNSELAKKYNSLYAKELEEAERNYWKKYMLISNRLKSANLMLPSRISNQGFYGSNIYTPTYQSIYKEARGGKIRARYIDYQNHIQKEQQDVRKGLRKVNETSTKKLDSDLDRLSKEQMILLRSIFK